MAETVRVNGITTWYDTVGAGYPLLLLHGGLRDSSDFDGNLARLQDTFQVFLPERRGHGHSPDVGGPLSFEDMALDTIAFLEEVVGGPAHLAGHSDGAVTALLVAHHRPDLVRRLVLISGVFHHSGWVELPDPAGVDDLPPAMAQRYAEISPEGADHWPVLYRKVAELAALEPTLTEDSLGSIPNRTLVMMSDDDVSGLEHTIAMYRSLPNAELAVVPGTSHSLIVEKPDLCLELVTEFLTAEPITTRMPVRRAAG